MDNRLNKIRKEMSVLRAEMLRAEDVIRHQVNPLPGLHGSSPARAGHAHANESHGGRVEAARWLRAFADRRGAVEGKARCADAAAAICSAAGQDAEAPPRRENIT